MCWGAKTICWRPGTPTPVPPRWLWTPARARNGWVWRSRHTPLDDSHATVEFVARYKLNGRAFRLHESSRFERMDGRWLYVDGEIRE
jgi:SEC-C motif-containing protein